MDISPSLGRELPDTPPAQPSRRYLRFGVFAILAAFLALLLIQFPAPPRADLDSAWQMTLVYAHQRGLQFGREIVFTFGPLGFLNSYIYPDGVPFIKTLWETAGKLAFAISMVAIGVSFGPIRFSCYYLALLLGAVIAPNIFPWFGLPLFALFWIFPSNAKPWQMIVAVTWMVLFSAIRFNYGMLAVAALALVSVFHFSRGEWRKPAALICGYGIGFLLLWMLAGQSLANLPAYVDGAWEITKGYVLAMSVDEMPEVVWITAAALWVIVAAFVLKRLRPATLDLRFYMLLFFGLTWFLFWKHGFTRADAGHVALFFPVAIILLVATPAGFGQSRQWTMLDFGPAICLVGLWLCHPTLVRDLPRGFVRRVQDNEADLFKTDRRVRRFAAGVKEDLRLHGKELRPMVGAETIDVFNYDQHEVLREHLNYHPRPIFQSYSAYTPALLQRNLDFYESENAPAFVFARLETVDDRYPAQDDSLLLEEFPRRYFVTRTAGDYLLLRRRPEQPRGKLVREALASREVSFGEEIVLPDSGGCSMEMRVRFRPSLYGSLRSALVQPAQVVMELTDSANEKHSGRLIPLMAEAGFLVQPLLVSQEDFSSFLNGEARASVRSIRFLPKWETANCWSSIKVEFFRLPELPLRQ
jgi:hypothetical protein